MPKLADLQSHEFRVKVRQLTSFRAVEESLINHGLVVKSALDELRLRCVAALLFLFLGFLVLSILVSLLDMLLPADWQLSMIHGVLQSCFRIIGSYIFFFYLPMAVLGHRTRWGEHVVAFYETRVRSGSDEAIALRGPAGMQGDKLRDLRALLEEIQRIDANSDC